MASRVPVQANDVATAERSELTLPDGARIDARRTALDDHGELGSQAVPIASGTAALDDHCVHRLELGSQVPLALAAGSAAP